MIMNIDIKYKLLDPRARAPEFAFEGSDHTMGIDVFTLEDTALWILPRYAGGTLEDIPPTARAAYTEVVNNRTHEQGCAFTGSSVHPHTSVLPYANIRTGIALDLPAGVHVMWGGRSGLAFKEGILPFMGLIDSNYRNELAVKIWSMNSEDNARVIKAGTKIAQLYVVHYQTQYALSQTEVLTDTARTDGFGSTGLS